MMTIDSTLGMQIATAGQFLKKYETSRYTFFEKNNFWSITVPSNPETFGDVSFWQAGMNWAEYKNHARAAIIRIGQGAWLDTEFKANYTDARTNGLILGGYWFYDGRNSPAQQAKIIIDAMQGKFFEMELYVDWERDYKGSYEGLKNVVALMKLLDAAGLHVKDIGMYTGYYWFTEHADATYYAYLKTKPLWLAWYASPNIVKVPAPWTNWTIWQSGTPVVKWGQPTAEIDFDVFNGSPADFTARYGIGVKMVKGTVLAVPSMNIRAGMDFATADMGDLFTGDIVYGDLVGQWIHMNQIWRKGGTIEQNSNYVYVGNPAWITYETVVSIPPVPTPAGDSYEVILNHLDPNGVLIDTYKGILRK